MGAMKGGADIERRAKHTTVGTLLLAVAGVGLAGLGCGEEIRVPNRPPELLCAADPICVTLAPSEDGDAVSIGYQIRDIDGDDQQVTVEICEAGGGDGGGVAEDSCGFAIRGGGDGGEWVPTDPHGGVAAHVFRWRFGCGRILPTGQRAVPTLQEPLVARVTLPGTAEARISETFSLEDLGFLELPDCNVRP